MLTILEVFCIMAALVCLGKIDTKCKVSYNAALLAGSVVFTGLALIAEGVIA